MAQANDHTESARIRTILEIAAFDLATLEYELDRHAYIPNSADDQKIRDATYRFYKASNNSQNFQYHTSTGHHNIFDPYPYGGMPQQEPAKAAGAQRAAAMADRNERVSVKYDAVRDLIRMLAARKIREGKPDATPAPAMKVEQAAVKLEAQLQVDKVKIKALEDQLQVMRTVYAAVKILAHREHAGEVRGIDIDRFYKLKQLALSPAAAEATETAQQFADIQMEKRAAAKRREQKVKERALERSKWAEAGGSADEMSQETSPAAKDDKTENEEMSTAEKDDDDENEEEEQSETPFADAPSAPGKGPRNRNPRALKRAWRAAMEMAAQAEDEEAAHQQRILSVQQLLADVEREIADGQERRKNN